MNFSKRFCVDMDGKRNEAACSSKRSNDGRNDRQEGGVAWLEKLRGRITGRRALARAQCRRNSYPRGHLEDGAFEHAERNTGDVCAERSVDKHATVRGVQLNRHRGRRGERGAAAAVPTKRGSQPTGHRTKPVSHG